MGEIELGAAAEATIQAYRQLAADPAKRLALALDRTCIQFLAYVVAEGEGQLVLSAVDTLALIAEAKECRVSLANTFGVLEALESVSSNEENYSEQLREKAAGLFTSLQFAKHLRDSSSTKPASKEVAAAGSASALPKQSDDVDGANSGGPSASASAAKVALPKSDPSSQASKPQASTTTSNKKSFDESAKSSIEKRDSFLGVNNSKAKVVTLFIKGMVNSEQRKLVEEELVRVRGLISIVFDLGHSRVTCRVKRDLSVEKLAAAVARTEVLSALQVTTDANGEEEMVPLGEAATETSPVEDLPDYLPEEESVLSDVSTAMAPSGTFVETASTWISSASSFLQKSFYW